MKTEDILNGFPGPRPRLPGRGLPGVLAVVFGALVLWQAAVWANPAAPAAGANKLTLARAEMCEAITEFSPHNTCLVFPVSRKVAHCFTLFDPVTEKTEIYHRWYHRDIPAATFRLTLQPPRWASYSSMQLRPGDKGPWRVDITDAGGKVMKSLRFSVTD